MKSLLVDLGALDKERHSGDQEEMEEDDTYGSQICEPFVQRETYNTYR